MSVQRVLILLWKYLLVKEEELSYWGKVSKFLLAALFANARRVDVTKFRVENTAILRLRPRKLIFAPCKGIRIPESRNFLLVESGILGFGIRNPALRIRNPTKDWNPESNLLFLCAFDNLIYVILLLLNIHSRLNWATRSKEKSSVYGKPPEGIVLNVTT